MTVTITPTLRYRMKTRIFKIEEHERFIIRIYYKNYLINIHF